MSDDFFESLFDVDGDGEITAADDMLDFMLFNEFLKDEEKRESDAKKEEWRIFAEDGSDYDLYPEDYETEEEYNEALREAKTAWRDEVEDGWEYNMDPEDYETEEEYDEALDEAKSKMASARLNAIECGLEPDEYETYDDLVETIDEAKHPWRSECEYGQEYGVYPEDYETYEEYVKAVRHAVWKSEQKVYSKAEPDEDEINKAIQEIEDDIYGVAFDSKTEPASGDKNQKDDSKKSTESVENAGSGDVIDGRKKEEQKIPNDHKQKFDEEKEDATNNVPVTPVYTAKNQNDTGKKIAIAIIVILILVILYAIGNSDSKKSSSYSSSSRTTRRYYTTTTQRYTTTTRSSYNTTTRSSYGATTRSSAGSSSKKYYSDDYDIDNYDDAEEFYYYHPDDFYDYEDAENYFNEHND